MARRWCGQDVAEIQATSICCTMCPNYYCSHEGSNLKCFCRPLLTITEQLLNLWCCYLTYDHILLCSLCTLKPLHIFLQVVTCVLFPACPSMLSTTLQHLLAAVEVNTDNYQECLRMACTLHQHPWFLHRSCVMPLMLWRHLFLCVLMHIASQLLAWFFVSVAPAVFLQAQFCFRTFAEQF